MNNLKVILSIVLLSTVVFAILLSSSVSAISLSDILSEIPLSKIYPSGLIAYYPFESNGRDVAGDYNANITSNGSLSFTAGKKANSLSFGSSNNATLRDSRDYDNFFKKSHTVSAWIYPNGWNSTGFNVSQAIVQQRGDHPNGGSGFILGVFSPDAENFSYYNITGCEYSDWHDKIGYMLSSPGEENNTYCGEWVTSNVRLENSTDLNKWYHVVAVYDSSQGKMKLYVNGNLENTRDVNASEISNTTGFTTDLVIGGVPIVESSGAEYGTGWRNFEGKIDEVQFYNKALSSSDVQKLYEIGSDNNAPDKIDDLDVVDVTDESIEWEWTNPDDDDFLANIIFFDGDLDDFDDAESYEADNLDSEEEYEIEIFTIDENGNVNLNGVSDSEETDEESSLDSASSSTTTFQDLGNYNRDLPSSAEIITSSAGESIDSEAVNLGDGRDNKQYSFNLDWKLFPLMLLMAGIGVILILILIYILVRF